MKTAKTTILYALINNQNGNALLGVVVAGVISGVIGMGTYSMISAQIRAQKMVGVNTEKSILRAQIQGVLSDSAVCASTLKDSSSKVAKYNPDRVLPPNPTPAQRNLYETENSLSKIALSSMVISQTGLDHGGLVVLNHSLKELDKSLRTNITLDGGGPGRRIVGKLQLDLGKNMGGSSTTVSSSIEFPIFLIVDASPGAKEHNILKCGTNNPSSGGNNNGSTKALSRLVVFNSTNAANWTVPVGVDRIRVQVWGGGGGGAGGVGSYYAGGGGGSGGYALRYMDVVPGSVATIKVGRGGSGRAHGTNTRGGTGADSSISLGSTLISATGGDGGFHDSMGGGPDGYCSGGAGGTSSGGDLNIQGGAGGSGFSYGGMGGGAPSGGGGGLGGFGFVTGSTSGGFPGGGGGGADTNDSNNGKGSDGASGGVVILY